ncbi:MAG TPA: BrnT family toxin [Candidatus Kapabacteria bacterium]|nr:BrnT family toxin [Candidatus Kapabacteria bacterium]HPO61452.1 BrnT family toxin [Candidatus Kapabacteria bacterium]
MEFEWDELKNKININKHNIDFNLAKNIFLDNNRKTSIDNRRDYGEIRYITIGKMQNVIITAVYVHRKEKIRIISARLSNSKERKFYFN